MHRLGGAIFEGGATSFINKVIFFIDAHLIFANLQYKTTFHFVLHILQGCNGRWQGVLSESQLAAYDALVQRKLTPECAAWLGAGEEGYFIKY